jgi:DNA-binding CsgD family transcriptional regulator
MDAHRVGRAREHVALMNWIGRANAGSMTCAFVAGEPGIGKTFLLQEVRREAEAQGATVVTGAVSEVGSTAPYGPWLAALRELIEQRLSPDAVGQVLGLDAGEVARVLPELRSILPALSQPPERTPEEARFALFRAFHGVLRRAATLQTLVVLLDDLHRADQASLDVLSYLVDQAPSASARLLVVGTYRSTETPTSYALSGIVTRVARSVAPIVLTGMSLVEIRALLAMTIQEWTIPAAVAEAIHGRTEGNPFFAVEIGRTLASRISAGDIRGKDVEDLPPPQTIQDTILERLTVLSEHARAALYAGAVAGRDFHFTTVQLATGMEPDRCAAALDEAIATRLLVAEPGRPRYRFTHALVAETLNSTLPPGRRMQLHQRIGDALESLYGAEADLHIDELADHFAEASVLGATDKAADYCHRAGTQAMARFAHVDACRWFERSVLLVESRPRLDERVLCDQLFDLAQAQRRAGDADASRATAQRAIPLALKLGEAARVGAALNHMRLQPWVERVGSELTRLLEGALALMKEGDSIQRVEVVSVLTQYLGVDRDRLDECAALSDEAMAMARRLGEPATLARMISNRIFANWRPETFDERRVLVDELLDVATCVGEADLLADAHVVRTTVLCEAGERAEVERSHTIARDMVATLNQPIDRWNTQRNEAMLRLLTGDFSGVEQLMNETLLLGQQFDELGALLAYGVQLFALRREQGRLHELVEPVKAFVQQYARIPAWQCGQAMILCESASLDAVSLETQQWQSQARTIFEEFAQHNFATLPPDYVWPLGMTVLAEVCAALGDRARAAVLYDQFKRYRAPMVMGGAGFICCGAVERVRGQLASVMQDWETAEGHFAEALAVNSRMGALPWVAHTKHEWAAMLIARGLPKDGRRAVALLREARDIAAELGMARLQALVDLASPQAQALTSRQQTRPGRGRPKGHDVPGSSQSAGLTSREVQILGLLCEGRSDRQIAEHLHVSPRTVSNHLVRIYDKTEVSGRAGAVAYALRHGLAPLDASTE